MWVANPSSAGVGGTYTWANAIAACKNLNYAGHTDWRLPNIKELMSIVDYEAICPSIDQSFFNCQCSYYWSSSSCSYSTGSAWMVKFDAGFVNAYSKTSAVYIRPVRGGQ